VQDWDDAPGAIIWPKMAKELAHVKATGSTSASHYSHDHLNEQKPVSVEKETVLYWKGRFLQIETAFAQKGERVVWVIVDGFLLYWHPDVYNALDLRIFLRVPEPTLKERRDARAGYHTAVLSDPEGTLWRDPPQYWENIVYPAYARAHQELFEDGDLESSVLTGKVPDLLMFDGKDMSMTELLDRACRGVSNAVDVDSQ